MKADMAKEAVFFAISAWFWLLNQQHLFLSLLSLVAYLAGILLHHLSDVAPEGCLFGPSLIAKDFFHPVSPPFLYLR
jgi:hypothetical protein